jgi:hypothetical protein
MTEATSGKHTLWTVCLQECLRTRAELNAGRIILQARVDRRFESRQLSTFKCSSLHAYAHEWAHSASRLCSLRTASRARHLLVAHGVPQAHPQRFRHRLPEPQPYASVASGGRRHRFRSCRRAWTYRDRAAPLNPGRPWYTQYLSK